MWSPQILHEVERSVLEANPSVDPAKFRTHTLASMLRVFPNASVVAAADADNEVAKIHEGDRHVALTAIASNANSILTINQRHFPKTALRHRKITIMTLGEFTQTLGPASRARRLAGRGHHPHVRALVAWSCVSSGGERSAARLPGRCQRTSDRAHRRAGAARPTHRAGEPR